MPDLLPDEVEAWTARLSTPMSPQRLSGMVDHLHGVMGDHFVTQRDFSIGREAWMACRFGKAVCAEKVWMCREHRPDFGLTLDGQTRMFEATEAWEPGRARDSEYAALREAAGRGESTVRPYPEEEWLSKAAQAPAMLRAASMKKAGKSYDRDCSLLIYLNLMVFGAMRQDIQRAIVEETSSAGAAFREVWVLWQERFHLAWRHGRPMREVVLG